MKYPVTPWWAVKHRNAISIWKVLLTRYKKMEYSADDIAAASILQSLAYLCTSMVAFWIYDYACSLHEEWTFLLRSRWTKVKGLYIITRHAPFFFLAVELYKHFTPNENLDKCRMSITLYSCFSTISVASSEFFFVLRTYALWNNNRIVLAAMLSAFLAAVVASIIVGFTTDDTSQFITSAIPNITGCYRTATNFTQFILLLAFQLGLISLTLVRVMQSWRMNNGPMYAILLKHNIFYYASGLFLSAINVLILMLFYDSAYHSLLEDFECLILAILATRMHLQLWQIDRDAHGSIALGIGMSDIVLADPMAYSAPFVE